MLEKSSQPHYAACDYEDGAQHSGAVDRRHFGATDDVAIFIDDTLDRATVRCLSSSPSAMAILSPQRLPLQQQHHTDASELDLVCGYAAGMSSSAKKKKPRRAFANDMTNHSNTAVQALSFKSEFATPVCKSKPHYHNHTSPARPPSCVAGTPTADGSVLADAACGTTPMGPPAGYVPLADFERVDRERHRYVKMYEHQRDLYEDMVATQQETYQKLQDKIVEVVALSTRNEEGKRFIRQLKREMLESRTRVLDLHNRQWDESRQDRVSSEKLRSLLVAQESQLTSALHQSEAKMAGLEGLIRDLTALRGEAQSIQVSQLDHLLKASYTKNAALFGDLVRQGRQVELLMDRKNELEKSLDMLRRDRKDMECGIAGERRHMNQQNERFVEQIGEQQRMILELRQCLVRSMASDSSSGSGSSSGEEEEEEVEVVEEDVQTERRWGLPVPPPPPPPTSYLVGSSASGASFAGDSAPVRPIRRLRAVPPPAPPQVME